MVIKKYFYTILFIIMAPSMAYAEGTPYVQIFIEKSMNSEIPYSKAAHLLFYTQPLIYKVIYTVVLFLIAVFLWNERTILWSAALIRKMGGYGIALTIFNLGVVMTIYAITSNVPNAMAAVGIALISSFVGYFVDESMTELILKGEVDGE